MEIEKDNEFWISAVLYLEQFKLNSINALESGLKRGVLTVFSSHMKRLKMLKRVFTSQTKFHFEKEIEMIKGAFNINNERSEFVFILQEVQQRILLCIDIDKEKFELKKQLKESLRSGEKANEYIRSKMQQGQLQVSAELKEEGEKLLRSGKQKEGDRKLQLSKDILDYVETADEAADLLADLFTNCKIKDC